MFFLTFPVDCMYDHLSGKNFYLKRVTWNHQVNGRMEVEEWERLRWRGSARTQCTKPTSKCGHATTSTRAGMPHGCSSVGVCLSFGLLFLCILYSYWDLLQLEPVYCTSFLQPVVEFLIQYLWVIYFLGHTFDNSMHTWNPSLHMIYTQNIK